MQETPIKFEPNDQFGILQSFEKPSDSINKFYKQTVNIPFQQDNVSPSPVRNDHDTKNSSFLFNEFINKDLKSPPYMKGPSSISPNEQREVQDVSNHTQSLVIKP